MVSGGGIRGCPITATAAPPRKAVATPKGSARERRASERVMASGIRSGRDRLVTVSERRSSRAVLVMTVRLFFIF